MFCSIAEETKEWERVQQRVQQQTKTLAERQPKPCPPVNIKGADPPPLVPSAHALWCLDPSTYPDFLSAADKELLSKCAAGTLTSLAPDLYKTMAVQVCSSTDMHVIVCVGRVDKPRLIGHHCL